MDPTCLPLAFRLPSRLHLEQLGVPEGLQAKPPAAIPGEVLPATRSLQRTVLVGTTSTLFAEAAPTRVAMLISAHGTEPVSFAVDGPAVFGEGLNLEVQNPVLPITLAEYGDAVRREWRAVTENDAESITVLETHLAAAPAPGAESAWLTPGRTRIVQRTVNVGTTSTPLAGAAASRVALVLPAPISPATHPYLVSLRDPAIAGQGLWINVGMPALVLTLAAHGPIVRRPWTAISDVAAQDVRLIEIHQVT